MADPPEEGAARWLRVHVRTTATASGDGQARSVYCASEQSYMPLAECVRCEHCFGLDRRDRATFLICQTPEAPAPARPLELPPPPTKGPLHQIDRVPVGEAMTTDVVCVTRDVGFDRLLTLLLDHEVSGLPVVDAGGEPIGVVSKTDVLQALRRHQLQEGELGATITTGDVELGLQVAAATLESLTVADIMAPLVFALPEEASVARAAAMMAFEGVHRVPIVDDGNVVVGLLSSADVLQWVARQAGYVLPEPPSR